MKTIKIKDIEISAEELRRIVSENKELLNEPEVKGRYFFPKNNGFYCIESYGDVNWCGVLLPVPEPDFTSMGVYKTRKDAELARDKQKAIVACWKWAQENAPFEPDWGNDKQEKFCTYYCHESNIFSWRYEFNDQYQFTLPYFKSGDDTEAFIKACKEHLTFLFTK